MKRCNCAREKCTQEKWSLWPCASVALWRPVQEVSLSRHRDIVQILSFSGSSTGTVGKLLKVIGSPAWIRTTKKRVLETSVSCRFYDPPHFRNLTKPTALVRHSYRQRNVTNATGQTSGGSIASLRPRGRLLISRYKGRCGGGAPQVRRSGRISPSVKVRTVPLRNLVGGRLIG